MADRVISQPDVQSLALAEPSQHVRIRWIIDLTLASLGMWMATRTPLQVVLALQLQDITPRHKIVALGVVTGVGAVSSALATPVVGALPTVLRTVGQAGPVQQPQAPVDAHHGRCSPRPAWGCWPRQGTVFGRGRAVGPVQRLPERRVRHPERGASPTTCRSGSAPRCPAGSACPIALGLVLGTLLVVDVLNQDLVTGYLALAILMVVLGLPFVLFTPDPPLAPEHREPFPGAGWAPPTGSARGKYPDSAGPG